MQKLKIYIKVALFVAVSMIILYGCSTISKVMNTISDLSNIQFKLGNVSNLTLNNVNISHIKSISDISISDGLKLTQAFANRSLPTNFTLNVLAKNPNTKSSTSSSNHSTLDAVISNIDWVLLIDDKETINGKVSSPLTVPAGSQSTTIPVGVGLDLYKFFGNKGYNDIVNLALAVGGVNSSSSRLKLKMKPTISIAGFPISYPNYITAIDKEFRG